jgi:hypothetical protein
MMPLIKPPIEDLKWIHKIVFESIVLKLKFLYINVDWACKNHIYFFLCLATFKKLSGNSETSINNGHPLLPICNQIYKIDRKNYYKI